MLSVPADDTLVEVGQVRSQLEPERVRHAQRGQMYIAGNSTDDQILGIHLKLRLGVTLGRQESESAVDAARHVQSQQPIEIAQLRDVQDELSMALDELTVGGHIALHVRALPVGITNAQAQRVVRPPVEFGVHRERRTVQRSPRAQRTARCRWDIPQM
jgi:hypothetical protein